MQIGIDVGVGIVGLGNERCDPRVHELQQYPAQPERNADRGNGQQACKEVATQTGNHAERPFAAQSNAAFVFSRFFGHRSIAVVCHI